MHKVCQSILIVAFLKKNTVVISKPIFFANTSTKNKVSAFPDLCIKYVIIIEKLCLYLMDQLVFVIQDNVH